MPGYCHALRGIRAPCRVSTRQAAFSAGPAAGRGSLSRTPIVNCHAVPSSSFHSFLQGHKIAGYGATGRGTIACAFHQLDEDTICYLIDDAPSKERAAPPHASTAHSHARTQRGQWREVPSVCIFFILFSGRSFAHGHTAPGNHLLIVGPEACLFLSPANQRAPRSCIYEGFWWCLVKVIVILIMC